MKSFVSRQDLALPREAGGCHPSREHPGEDFAESEALELKIPCPGNFTWLLKAESTLGTPGTQVEPFCEARQGIAACPNALPLGTPQLFRTEEAKHGPD